MSFLRMRRKFVGGTRTPAVGALQLQPRNQTVNGTGGGTGTVVAGLPFTDGFESGNFNLWDSVGGVVTNVTTEHFEGARAAQTSVASGQQSDNYLEYRFGDHLGIGGTPVGMNEIWCRFAHKWASNWTEGAGVVGQKLWLLNHHNPTTNARRYQVTFNIWGPAAAVANQGRYFFDIYRWNEDGSFNQTIHNITLSSFLRVLGRWEEFVFRIRMNNPGVSDGQLDAWIKAEGDTSYTQHLARTNLNFRDATSITPNRLIGLSNFDTITTRSGNRYWDSVYIGQEEVDLSPDPGGDDNDGLVVTNFANFDPDDASIISIDINSTVPTRSTNGAIVTAATESWWNGNTGVITMRPPTGGDSYSGIGQINFWKNATKAIRQFNMRWEVKFSDLHLLNGAQLPKLMILVCHDALDVFSEYDRPMLFTEHAHLADNASNNVQDALVMCPSQGTVRCFSSTNITPAATQQNLANEQVYSYYNVPMPFYLRATAGTGPGGNPIVDADEILCVEVRINTQATTGESQGVIAYRVTRRNGHVSERACAWTYWDPVAAGDPVINRNFISYLDVMGGGYYNNAQATNVNLWTKMGRRMTFGFNLNPTVGRHFIGPPTGFVT
jgi:hypothetical protein